MSEQPQVMQVTIAKSAAELEYERRQQVIRDRKLAIVDLYRPAKAQYDADEAAGNIQRHDYTVRVQQGEDSLLIAWEGASRQVIQRCRLPEDVITDIPYDIIDDEENRLSHNITVINTTRLFRCDRAVLTRMIMTMSSTNDSDVAFTFQRMMEGATFKTEWPTDTISATIPDVFLLLKQQADNCTVMVDKEGRIGTLSNVEYIPAGMFNPEGVAYRLVGYISQNGQLVQTELYCNHFESKNFEADMPVRSATMGEIEEAAVKGKAMHEMLSSSGHFAHLNYQGIGLIPGPWGSRIRHVINGRVVVDPEALRLLDTNRLSNLLNMAGMDIVEDDDGDRTMVEAPTAAQYAAMRPAVVFYDLNKQMWLFGDANHMTPIQYRADAFDQLVLEPGRKRLVNALVVHSATIRQGTPDIIDGKGGGAIFLLDGPPGTGKTLTAEATAEKLQRVLYKVGMGELGTDAQQLERKLQQILGVAARWDAVLLLDEADVFLEKRSSENLHRNAMVAVFLRLLEYYSGIMFLTTNRGDNFDPAVLSRITLALHFTKLEEEDRKEIWVNLLRNAGITVTETELGYLAQIETNGREIKNAINSSRALAAEDQIPVNYHHLREILDATSTFRDEVTKAKR